MNIPLALNCKLPALNKLGTEPEILSELDLTAQGQLRHEQSKTFQQSISHNNNYCKHIPSSKAR